MTGIALQMKMMADLLRAHNQFNEGLAKFEEYVKEVRFHAKNSSIKVAEAESHAKEVLGHMERIKNLPKGEKGDTPTINTGAIIESVKEQVVAGLPPPKIVKAPPAVVNEERIAARVLKLTQKKEVTAPEIDHEKLADIVVKKISEGKKLKTKHIDGLDAEMATQRSQLAGKIYGKDTWARGAGDTVDAGSNITITNTSDGKKRINSTGGSSTIYNDAVSGVIDGVNTVFTVAHTISSPIILILANSSYQATVDYNTGGTTITMTTAPDISLSGQPFFLVHT